MDLNRISDDFSEKGTVIMGGDKAWWVEDNEYDYEEGTAEYEQACRITDDWFEVPSWQKRGMGVYWENYEKQGYNPITGKEETAERRALKVDDELPLREEYSNFIAEFLKE